MDKLWKQVKTEYKLKSELGAGSYGQVMLAKHRHTKQKVAIKLIRDCFKDACMARKTYREVKILRKLSSIPKNIFTTRLIDIILPEGVMDAPGSHANEGVSTSYKLDKDGSLEAKLGA